MFKKKIENPFYQNQETISLKKHVEIWNFIPKS